MVVGIKWIALIFVSYFYWVKLLVEVTSPKGRKTWSDFCLVQMPSPLWASTTPSEKWEDYIWATCITELAWNQRKKTTKIRQCLINRKSYSRQGSKYMPHPPTWPCDFPVNSYSANPGSYLSQFLSTSWSSYSLFRAIHIENSCHGL